MQHLQLLAPRLPPRESPCCGAYGSCRRRARPSSENSRTNKSSDGRPAGSGAFLLRAGGHWPPPPADRRGKDISWGRRNITRRAQGSRPTGPVVGHPSRPRRLHAPLNHNMGEGRRWRNSPPGGWVPGLRHPLAGVRFRHQRLQAPSDMGGSPKAFGPTRVAAGGSERGTKGASAAALAAPGTLRRGRRTS